MGFNMTVSSPARVARVQVTEHPGRAPDAIATSGTARGSTSENRRGADRQKTGAIWASALKFASAGRLDSSEIRARVQRDWNILPVIVRTTALLGCAVLLLAGCGGAKVLPASSASPLLGRPLPQFRRATLDGANLDTSRLRGRPVVVEFFAAYCEPCKRTLPATQELSQRNARAAFVGISADDYASTARAVVAEHGLTFAVVHDAGHVLQGRFRVRELPVTFVADANGTVRWVGGPEHGAEDLARALDAIE